jgi:hypothetical protein
MGKKHCENTFTVTKMVKNTTLDAALAVVI